MFIYFLPGHVGTAVTPQQLEAAGLGYLADQSSPETLRCEKGPGGGAGLLVKPLPPKGVYEAHTGYSPEQQTWKPHPTARTEAGAVWIGMWNEQKPTGNHLKRAAAVAGHPVQLHDGVDWVVPVAFSTVGGITLDLVIGLVDGSAEVAMEVVPKFRKLADLAERVAEVIYARPPSGNAAEGVEGATEERGMPWAEAAAVAAAALAVNYRVSLLELSMLGVLSTHNCSAVLRALVDVPGVEKVLASRAKKPSAPAPSPTSAG